MIDSDGAVAQFFSRRSITIVLAHMDVRVVTDLIEMRAALTPDRVAYRFAVDGDVDVESITYRELRDRTRWCASRLIGTVQPGDRVILACPPGLTFVSCLFGALAAGATVAPIYPHLRKRGDGAGDPWSQLIDDSAAAAIITTRSIASGVQRACNEHNVRLLDCTELGAPRNVDEIPSLPSLRGESMAILQYTSGSIAQPKGVLVSHAQLLHASKVIAELFGSSSNSVGVIWLPPYHDMGLVGGILQPLFAGFPVTLFSPFRFAQRPARWLKAISDQKATISGGPDFAYDLCLQSIAPHERRQFDLGSWEVAFNGADTVHSRTLEAFASAFAGCGFRREALYPCYGLAEATLLVTGGDRRRPPTVATFDSLALRDGRAIATAGNREATRLVGLGSAGPGLSVVIVEPATRRRLGDRTVGEIWVSGPTVACGYHNNAAETERVFLARLADDEAAGPFLRTGDLGFLHGGELFVTGRLKDVLVVRGLKFAPQDLEEIAETAEGAIRAAAFMASDDGSGDVALVVESDRDDANEHATLGAAVRRAVAAQLDLPIHTVAVVPVGAIPRTTSGKVQRQRCRSMFLQAS